MGVEQEGEKLRKEKDKLAKQYEDKVNSEKAATMKFAEQLNEMAYQQFVQLAEKDFKQLEHRLDTDYEKFKSKVKDEGVAYELKTKANLIAMQAERLLNTNGARDKRSPTKATPTKSFLSTVQSKSCISENKSPIKLTNK